MGADNLRTRIAAVQSQHRSYGNDCECGWVDETGLYKQFTGHEQHVADAVIAELGLKRIVDYCEQQAAVGWRDVGTGTTDEALGRNLVAETVLTILEDRV